MSIVNFDIMGLGSDIKDFLDPVVNLMWDEGCLDERISSTTRKF